MPVKKLSGLGDGENGQQGASRHDHRPKGQLASAAGQLADRMENWVDLVSQMVKNPPAMQESWV